jgi:hypothetical protein
MMVTYGPKHVASHTIKYDGFDVRCCIILISNTTHRDVFNQVQEISEVQVVQLIVYPAHCIKMTIRDKIRW